MTQRLLNRAGTGGSRSGASPKGEAAGRPPHLVQFGPGIAPVRRAPTPLARRFFQMCVGMQADALASADLTALQYAALASLNRNDGEPGIDQISLAQTLGVDRSHVTLVVEELQARALLERRVNGADRRARLLFLTPKAEKLYERVRPAIRAANARVLEPLLARERELFVDMLIRMIGANGAHARPGAGRRKRNHKQVRTKVEGQSVSLDGRSA